MDATGLASSAPECVDDNSSGNGRPCTTPDLAPADEAALLAEYGVQGPYDDLLDVAAPSHFRSDYGDLSVFLTTADAGAKGDDDECCDVACLATSRALTSSDLVCPSLEALLVKHTSVLSDGAAPSLVDHLHHAMEHMAASPSPSRASRRPPQQHETLHESDKVNGPASLAAGNDEIADDSGEDDRQASLLRLLQESDRLLDEAGRCASSGDAVAAETSSASLTARLQAIKEEEDVLCNDAYDLYLDAQDDLDADAALSDAAPHSMQAVLDEARAHVVAWRRHSAASATLIEQRGQAIAADTATDNAVEDVRHECTSATRRDAPTALSPPPLYAFEVCPTHEECARLAAWHAVEQRSKAQHALRQAVVLRSLHKDPVLLSDAATLPDTATLSDPALDAIVSECARRERDLAEARPAVLQAVAALSRPGSSDLCATAEVVRVTHAEDAVARQRARRRRRREEEGYVVLQRFTERVDEFIAPAPEELALREEVSELGRPSSATSSKKLVAGIAIAVRAGSDGSEVEGAGRKSALHVKARRDVRSSTKTIQRQSAILCWRLEREAAERRCMRQEEQNMAALVRAAETRGVALAAALADCMRDSQTYHDTLREEEQVAFAALRASAQRQRELARRAAALRQVAMTAQLAQQMLREHAAAASDVHEAESRAFVELSAQAVRACEEATSRAQARRHAELERLVSVFADIRQDALLQKSSSGVADEMCAAAPTPCCSKRVAALLDEHAGAAQWAERYAQLWANALQRLQDELVVVRGATHQLPPAAQHAMPSGQCARPDAAGAACLDEALVRRVQTSVMAAVAAGRVADVRTLFFALSFALEQISYIDWPSLARMQIQPGRRRTTGEGEDGESMAAAPLVRQLDLSGNQLAAIDLAALLSTFPSLSTLTLSGNALAALSEGRRSAMGKEVPTLPRSASLRGAAAAQTSAFAARLHLHRVDLSNNQLHDLSCVGVLLADSLTELVAYTNQIDSAAALVTCRRLQRVDLSHNKLTSLAGCASLMLLRELNVCDNAIADTSALAVHNVLLQKLYVSRNPLSRAMRPDASLCMPFLTQLFVNHAGLRTLGAVVTALPLLSVLHAEGNELTELAPLVHCPRLVALKLSFNRLACFAALRPLAACRALVELDVSENPFLPGYHLRDTAAEYAETIRQATALPQARVLPPDMHDALLYMLPNLRELNHEPVSRAQHARARAMAARVAHDTPTLFAELRLAATRRDAHARAAARRTCLAAATAGEATAAGLTMACRRVFGALCHDAALTGLRTRLDVQALADTRRVQVAEAASPSVAASLAAQQQRLQYVAQCRAEADRAELAEVHDALRTLLSVTTAAREAPCCNVFCRTASYAEGARREREQLARRAVAAWCHACILGRRARAEARRLREEAARLTSDRRAWAVSVIQPVWRGAALRSRLRRLLPVSDDEDDEAAYCKVEVPFAEMTLADKTPAGLGLGVVVRQVMDTHVPLPRFAVSAGPARAGTAPTGTEMNAPQTLSPSAGGGDGVGRQRSHRSPATTARTSTRLGELQEAGGVSSDGVDYAALVARKRRKMQSVHQQFLRQEFMRDPLKAKRLETASSNGRGRR